MKLKEILTGFNFHLQTKHAQVSRTNLPSHESRLKRSCTHPWHLPVGPEVGSMSVSAAFLACQSIDPGYGTPVQFMYREERKDSLLARIPGCGQRGKSASYPFGSCEFTCPNLMLIC